MSRRWTSAAPTPSSRSCARALWAGQAVGGRVPPGLGWLFAPEGPAPHPPPGEAGRQVRARTGSRLEWTSPLGAVSTTDPPDPGDEAWTQRVPLQPSLVEAAIESALAA